MIDRGYTAEFAAKTFSQIEGFGSYGFPESHAASFAIIAYASSWVKCHHPDIFCCALLNAQPMGFYAPAQIVRDAREHGVEIRPVDVNHSRWDSALEPGDGPYLAVRLGLRMTKGLAEAHGVQLVLRRGEHRLRLDRRTLAPRRRAGGGARAPGGGRRLWLDGRRPPRRDLGDPGAGRHRSSRCSPPPTAANPRRRSSSRRSR